MDLEDKSEELDDMKDDLREELYLEFLFGSKSRVTYEEFMQISTREAKIYELWYKPENLRAVLLHKLEVKQDNDKLADFCKRVDL